MECTNNQLMDENTKRLVEIGAIFDSMGICSIEIAKKVKDHLEGCPGGRECINKIMSKLD